MSPRGLAELLVSPAGRTALAARGIHRDPATFMAALRPPAQAGLQTMLDIGDAPLVYVGQQLRTDYPASVVTKLCALRDLTAAGTPGMVLGLDTDRVGSEKALGVLRWSSGQSVRLVPRSADHRELRLAPVAPDRLADACATLLGRSAPSRGQGVPEPVRRLQAELHAGTMETIADVSAVVTRHLLDHLDLPAPLVRMTDLLDRGLIEQALTAIVDAIEDVTATYNAAIDALAREGIDAVVRRRASDELPLYYSCPADGRRLRLRHERQGGMRLAVTVCRCARSYQFELGRREVTLAEITATGRWSTDVTLPIYLNPLVSGVVAGRSSALYGLVLNEVLTTVLGAQPVPMLVPDEAALTSGRGLFVADLMRR